MLNASIQTVLAAAACVLLFLAIRKLLRNGNAPAAILAAGVFVRAIGGQLAFWISYLELPVGRGLQLGRGLWFYASDGQGYFNHAVVGAERGLGAIFSLDPSVISPGFTQVLALFAYLFGSVVSTALLLNLAAYLGTCAIVIALAGQQKRLATIAVAAISFSPSSILWSTQPLKDVFFLFLFAAFAGVVAMWIKAWHREERPFVRAVLMTLLMLAVLCTIAAIRWYFALALLLISAPVLAAASLRTRMPLRALALLVAMYAVVLAGAIAVAGPFFPARISKLILSPDLATVARAPGAFADTLKGVRFAFDRQPGNTQIEPGPAVSGMPAARFVSGSAVFVLPRLVTRPAGLADMKGGRGLWLFADVDTIFFDVFLLIAIVALVRAKWRNPLLWLVAGITLFFAAAFVYSIGNFGALFRYRSMIFLGVVLIPVVAAWPYPAFLKLPARLDGVAVGVQRDRAAMPGDLRELGTEAE